MRKLPYHPSYLCFITTVTKNRRPLFRDRRLAERLGIMIHMACRLKGFVPLAYAIMPDHLHFLVCDQNWAERTLEKARSNDFQLSSEGDPSRPPSPDVAKLIQSIKGTFSRTVGPGAIWQKRYFAWYLNNPAAVTRVVDYIGQNHIRAGLPEFRGREPFLWIDENSLAGVIGAS